jgi:DNA-directed RNA polymerase subunit RPC12/RpoP
MATFVFELHRDCLKCAQPIPINALVSRLTCSSCLNEADLPRKFWQSITSEAFWARVMLNRTKGRAVSIPSDEVKGQMGWGEPLCPRCKAPLHLPGALEAAATSGHLDCPGCGQPLAVRPVPRNIIPPQVDYLLYAIGEEPALLPGAAAAIPTPASTKPLLFPCPACNASLPVDGASRTVECTYCRSNAYLPDDLWRRLHPVRTISRWYLWIDEESPRVKGYLRADSLQNWLILVFWLLVVAAIGAFAATTGTWRWGLGVLFSLMAVLSFLASVRAGAKSVGDSFP